MKTYSSTAILRTAVGASFLLVAGLAAAATTTVNLTAQPSTAVLPDGTSVPMWGYCTDDATTAATNPALNNGALLNASPCTTATALAAVNRQWAPGPTIVVPAGNALTIKLTNKLALPTSIVVLGQVGGGVGGPSRLTGFAQHAPQTQTTWPGNGPGDANFTPPAQLPRVQSFGGEATAGSTVPFTWGDDANYPLKPGTYIYETGTLPSIEAPMGLYGVLIVTTPVAGTGSTFTAGTAYPVSAANPIQSTAVTYDSEVALLFSEIDPVQNNAVNAAALAKTDVKLRFDNPACAPTCYPAAVNYRPAYYLINGQSYDQVAPAKSAFAVAGTSTEAGTFSTGGNVLVRLANAGLRTHTPSIVGLPMSIVAEDGNRAPGNPKLQNEVLLTAGKTHDVIVHAAMAGTGDITASSVYAAATYPIIDRSLGLSAANALDGGMHGFLQIAGGAGTGSPGALPDKVTPTANPDSFQVPYNSPFNGNVKTNDIAVVTVAKVSGPVDSTSAPAGTVTLNPDGTFVFTPVAGFNGTATFTYNGNAGATNTATVTLNVGTQAAPPVAVLDAYTSGVATRFTSARPGVLANDNGGGYPLTAVLDGDKGTCDSVALQSDGSFTATFTPTAQSPSCTFKYKATNSQGTASASTAVTVTFLPIGMKTGLAVLVKDLQNNKTINDYRWVIQEDLTFKVDPKGTPALSTRTIGTSFHKSHMPIVATGCVGVMSCGSGQAYYDSVNPIYRDIVKGTGTLGSRHVRTKTEALALQTLPSAAVLDPLKHYYISILPGDAAGAADGSDGHAMGGSEISPAQVASAGTATPETITINANSYPFTPAQLSIYVYEDNAPVNGQDDLNEPGLGGFNVILVDAAGRSGDTAGQQTFDAAGMPLSNALLGTPGCPDDLNKTTNGTASSAAGNLVGLIYTCPNVPPGGNPADYTLAGHALIKNVTPARYDVIIHPGAGREDAGEVWWQTETLEGTPAQDAFTGVKEPVYFQEFGPPGFHTTVGFVNPAKVKSASLGGTHSITGKVTNQHMSRPSEVQLWDSETFDLLSSTTCQVAANSQGGTGPAVAIASCDRDGNFKLTGLPNGTYEVAVWDQWLDQIIQTVAVTINNADYAMNNVPVLSWFTQYDQNIYMDLNKDGIYQDNEPGIANVTMTTRYRDGGISNQTATDSHGNGLLAELFPLFNWYVTEADTTRFKQTGVNIMVDAGGPVAADPLAPGLWNSTYKDCSPDAGAQPCSTNEVKIPGAYSYGLQGFISERNTINWGRTPYATGENGGIQGVVVYSTTRPFDDQRYNVQTIWEPLVPRVTVNLYRKEKLADGTDTLTKVDSVLTTSWDDWVNATKADGTQANMTCPGQDPNDPFVQYTLAAQSAGGTVDQFRCYDGFHNWNQVQPAPYDGRYAFPSAAYITAHAADPKAPGQTLVSLPPGQYVIETVTPAGYEIVKEEDKNILNGDAFDGGPAPTQFAGIGNVFILPDQATLNNANPYNLNTGDGIHNNATSDLGVTSSSPIFAECVGNLHRVPDYLSLFPQGQLVAPFAGMDRPLCDRKLVNLNDQMQASANFFLFSEVPMAANGTGIVLDDASSEFNAASPDFGEKASVPFVPVSIKDFNGREITRTYSDQWGAYNVMTPSSWLVNPPTPSGYGPNMLVTCINDPGPIAARNAAGQMIDADGDPTNDPAMAKMISDPQFNPAFSNFCYTLPYMPGRTTYLDTPVLPIAAFAAGYNPVDCALPDLTPMISRVDSSAGIGPYLTRAGGTLTIKALGNVEVPNPGYAGPFADPNNPADNPASKRTLTRHYGFGSTGTVTLNGVALAAFWSDTVITATVPANATGGQLVIKRADNGNTSVDAVTVTIEDATPVRVAGPSPVGTVPGAIQSAIDTANPGDLILVDAGSYSEVVIMWKPVRLQGVGASSVIINAAKYPTQKLEAWRPAINSLFAVDTVTGNQIGTSQVDPLPGQEITGGIVLLEPSVLGTEEGAGITVLGKDLLPGQCTGGDLSTYITPDGATHHVTESNFNCKSSRIDGVSVTGGDAGGGIYVNGWAHGIEIANNRVFGNAGAFNGGIRIGVPYLENLGFPGLSENANGNVTGTPALSSGKIVGWGFDNGVKIHNNSITKNGVVEGPAGGGGAGGGVSICTGTDGYSVDHNWVCGNFSSADGGGIGHIGFSQGGTIAFNQVLFNQSFQQTTSTHGGGIAVVGEPALFGATLSPGSGDLRIDSNVIRGNFAEAGHGGGIRLQQVNGGDVAAFPNNSGRWHKVTVTNNIVDNNVAGWSGGGMSFSDALNAAVVNNTVVQNDSAGIAGVIIVNSAGAPVTGSPHPAGISSDQTSAQLLAALPNSNQRNANAISQPTNFSNNIVWHNRSFFFDTSTGSGRLCNSNAGTGSCTVLPDQTTTGECVAVESAKYWDLGSLADGTVAVNVNQNLRLKPTFSVLSSTTGYTVANGDNANNSANDPTLQDVYCNGSRVTPEFNNGGNPPSVKNLQVAATLDEGNNYVNMRFGPLSLSKPTDSSGTSYAAFGDDHIRTTPIAATAATSSALDHGTVGIVTHDIDNQTRPMGARWDIGADEFIAAAPMASIAPTSLTFGNQALGSVSAPKQVVVTNTGTAALVFNAAAPAATAGVSVSGNFAISGNTCAGATVQPNATCTVSVTFNPTGNNAGNRTGALTFRDNAASSPQNVSLSGTAVNAVTITPPLIGFNATKVGTASSTVTVTFTNNQAVPVTFNAATPANTAGLSITTNGTSAAVPQGEFVIVPVSGTNCASGTSVAAGASCVVGVQFKPAGNTGFAGLFGFRSGVLTFRDNAPGSPQTVTTFGVATP
jgi:hypothetical protein